MTLASNNHFLWTEKYRPPFEDVIIPQELRETLLSYMKNKKIPSFLFYSPTPGTGKTTTAKAIANYMGSDHLFINASIENSIDVIRMQVIQFATTSSMFSDAMKIVVLDEADRLSQAAQDGLKGVMEQVSANCAFILTCNNKAKLIEPLRSRVTEVDFIYTAEQQQKLSVFMLKRVLEILKQEQVEYDPKAVATLVNKYVPDNRKLLNELQRYSTKNGKIDVGILAEAESRDFATFLKVLKAKDFQGTLKWCTDNSDSIGDDFYNNLYTSLKDVVTDQSHAQLILTTNEYQRYHSIVPDRFLHFASLATHLMMEVSFK